MDESYTGQAYTGYRANDAGDNWCYFDGVDCTDTLPMAQTPLGVFVDSAFPWDSSSNLDCSDSEMTDSINQALQGHMANIASVIAGRCILWDYSTEKYVSASCDSKATFVCERKAWSCDTNSPCSHICNPAGYCVCPETHFLTDFFTCTPIPDLTEIECLHESMVAWFSVTGSQNFF